MADLIYLAVIFLILALVFFIMGMKGIAGFTMEIAKWLVIIFVIVAVVTFIFGGAFVGIKLQKQKIR